MSTLTHERAGVAQLHLAVRKKVRRLIDAARDRGADRDPVHRRRLAQLYVEAELLKLLADRAISAAAAGRPPGPESSVVKLWWSEVQGHVSEVAGEILGADANRGDWGRERVAVRALGIAGGTTQVNKNLVAQRVLGLPKE